MVENRLKPCSISLALGKGHEKIVSSKARQGPSPSRRAACSFSSCRAALQQLSSVAQSYPQVQSFLTEGSDGALGKL
jgi:hypothetical protein